jgi:hypothetical protein
LLEGNEYFMSLLVTNITFRLDRRSDGGGSPMYMFNPFRAS